jgi:glyoxylate reductase
MNMATGSRPRILLTAESADQMNTNAIKRLRQIAEVDVVESSAYSRKSELLKVIGNYEGVIIASNIPLDREVIDGARRLRVISRLGVGYDLVDVKAATERRIWVAYTPVLSETVVDTTFGLLFAVARNIAKADAYVKAGNWKLREDRKKFTGTDVFGKTLGIIGLGRIGSLLAKRAGSFEMPVLYYDVVRHMADEREDGVAYVPLDQLLARSDFISVHIPLTEATRGLIGEKELHLMKKTAFLINTSRGPVVDEKALAKALSEGRIAGAGLDVYEKEPLSPDNPLLRLGNVVLTPHLGGGTRECEERIQQAAVENVISVLEGKEPIYPVTP